MPATVIIGSVPVGGGAPLALIAGPCGLESLDLALRVGEGLARVCDRVGVPLVFKGSFDKANRTRGDAWRGPGIDEGLAILDRVKRELGVPVTTDVHLPQQASAVAEVAELLQVPAFLCRQTDLVVACAATGRPVNLKKGQFLAPGAMVHAVAKAAAAPGVLVTERGTGFGYGDLVVDLRAVDVLHAHGIPVVFDATHSAQRPGSGGTTGGERRHLPTMTRAAIAAGVDAIFAEVHPAPRDALSDAATQLPLDGMERLVSDWRRLSEAVSSAPLPEI